MNNKTKFIKLLKDFHEELANMDLSNLNMLEAAKIIDLFADIQDVVDYLGGDND